MRRHPCFHINLNHVRSTQPCPCAFSDSLRTPVGASKAVIATLNDAVNKAMVSPGLLEKYAANGVDPVGGSVEAFGALIKSEVQKYAMIAKTLKAKVD